MKTFESVNFDRKRCIEEVSALRKWLGRNAVLEERKQILPFFRKRRFLSAFLGSYGRDLISFDRIAFELSLFGDFACDLVVGDSARNAYCFIEFEDAAPNSLFVKQGRRATREWSSRFDHGFSQIIDWFCKLDDMKKSDAFAALFGARSICSTGILVVGRNHDLLAGETERLEWRRNNVLVGSQIIECLTFDRLLADLQTRLKGFQFYGARVED